MHRTEGTYNNSGFFSNGPPGTRVEENWLNAIQEELAYVIEQASITLLTADTETRQQLKQALDSLYTQLEIGTVMLFGQNSPPTGWTRKTNWVNNAMLCIAATGDIGSGGTANPQSTHLHTGPSHYHTTSSHAITIAEMPIHDHVYQTGQNANLSPISANGLFGGGTLDDTSNRYYTEDTGSGQAHSHGNTGSSGTANTGSNTQPAYQEVIAATKD